LIDSKNSNDDYLKDYIILDTAATAHTFRTDSLNHINGKIQKINDIKDTEYLMQKIKL